MLFIRKAVAFINSSSLIEFSVPQPMQKLKIDDNVKEFGLWIFLFLYEVRLFAGKAFLAEKQRDLKIPGSYKQWKAKKHI